MLGPSDPWHQYSIYFVDTGDINTHENPAVIASTSTKSSRPLAILLPKKVISVQEQMTGTEDSGASCDARLGRCGV